MVDTTEVPEREPYSGPYTHAHVYTVYTGSMCGQLRVGAKHNVARLHTGTLITGKVGGCKMRMQRSIVLAEGG